MYGGFLFLPVLGPGDLTTEWEHCTTISVSVRKKTFLLCQPLPGTISFHNFKSQNFKSSVSNPKSKYVAYLSVLSQISNCQGLGRKNKHDILKTDRN